MTDSLNVLVLESEPGAATSAVDELERAGHSVARCHDATGALAFPCNALVEGGACPLEASVIDVALDVRGDVLPEPSPFEDGISCAALRHVPIVVAGRVVLNPFHRYATAVVKGTDGVAEACERAARAPLPRHAEAAMSALVGVLERHGFPHARPELEVVRHAGALRVGVRTRQSLDHTTRNVASARIVGALRAIDGHARGIDVDFATY